MIPNERRPINEYIEAFRTHYESNIKSLIDEGDYDTAYFELANSIFIMECRQPELVTEVHSGLSFLASMTMLNESLKEKNLRKIASSKEQFEAFLSQTSLPLGEL
jgi:hypothetical protein